MERRLFLVTFISSFSPTVKRSKGVTARRPSGKSQSQTTVFLLLGFFSGVGSCKRAAATCFLTRTQAKNARRHARPRRHTMTGCCSFGWASQQTLLSAESRVWFPTTVGSHCCLWDGVSGPPSVCPHSGRRGTWVLLNWTELNYIKLEAQLGPDKLGGKTHKGQPGSANCSTIIMTYCLYTHLIPESVTDLKIHLHSAEIKLSSRWQHFPCYVSLQSSSVPRRSGETCSAVQAAPSEAAFVLSFWVKELLLWIMLLHTHVFFKVTCNLWQKRMFYLQWYTVENQDFTDKHCKTRKRYYLSLSATVKLDQRSWSQLFVFYFPPENKNLPVSTPRLAARESPMSLLRHVTHSTAEWR